MSGRPTFENALFCQAELRSIFQQSKFHIITIQMHETLLFELPHIIFYRMFNIPYSFPNLSSHNIATVEVQKSLSCRPVGCVPAILAVGDVSGVFLACLILISILWMSRVLP